jgi:hypothetical protein
MARDGIRFISSADNPDVPDDALPELLDEAASKVATDWLRQSLLHFRLSVDTFVPRRFASYARIYHPFEVPAEPGALDMVDRSWEAVGARSIRSVAEAAEFALSGLTRSHALVGTLPPRLIDSLITTLAPHTRTPDDCCFAVWEGYGDLPARLITRTPTLHLPQRNYHVFRGPLSDARRSYSFISFSHRSANLWWPADRAWCVATEVDYAWTYVGGSYACIDAVLADHRLEAVATTADAEW